MSKILNSDGLVSFFRFLLILVAIVFNIFIITRVVIWYHSL
jgi:hypothetical protein